MKNVLPDELTEEQISALLLREREVDRGLPLDAQMTYRSAAVLVPLFCLDHEWRILYTRRAERLSFHSGQVSFPGGAAEPEDSNPEATALREAMEEIGIVPEDVFLLGRMAQYQTISGYQVTPVVGRITYPYPFSLQVHEVSRVFSIPLKWLADRSNWELRWFTGPTGEAHEVIFYNEYDGETLWGITARITLNLLEMLDLV